MANRLKMVQKELLFSLFEKGWSNRKINNALQIDRRTISRYRQLWVNATKQAAVSEASAGSVGELQPVFQNAPPKCPPMGVVHFQVPTDPPESFPIHSKSRASQFHDTILQKLEKGQQARSIYQDLVIEQDYLGGYDAVKRYIRKLKKLSPKLYARIETPPGEEAQVDFGTGAPVLKNGRRCRTWLFTIKLSNSRKSYEEIVWHQDVETFIRCHERGFQFFGGIPKVIKIDNLKSAVLKAHLYEPELNPNYLAFSKHYGFIPLPCKVATPEHKGKVESHVKYVQNNALKGKQFASIEEQNAYLRHWNKRWASTRIHGTTKRQVELMFQEEKPTLLSLPDSPYAFFKIGLRRVNSIDSHIEVAGAYYPIPPIYMGKEVTVHFNTTLVKVFYQGRLIQKLSAISKGHFHPDKRCLPENKNFDQIRFLQHLFVQCEQIGPSVFTWAKEAERTRGLSAYRSILGIVALTKKFSADVINWACCQSANQNVFNYHIVKQMTEARSAQLEIQYEINFIQENELIRSPQDYQNLFFGKE
jgi:transposase